MFSNSKKSRATTRVNTEKKHVRFNTPNAKPEKSRTSDLANAVRSCSYKSLGIAPTSATLFYDPKSIKPFPSNCTNKQKSCFPPKSKSAKLASTQHQHHNDPATIISSTELSEIHKLAQGNYSNYRPCIKVPTTNNLISQQPVPVPQTKMLDYNKDRPMTLIERKRLQWEREREELNSLGTPWGCPMSSSTKSISTQNLSSWTHSDSKIGPTPLIVSSEFMSSITNPGSDYRLPKIGLSENNISKQRKYDIWSSSGDLNKYHRKLSAEEEFFTSGYQSEVGNTGWMSSGPNSRNGSGDNAVKQMIATDVYQTQGNRRHTITVDLSPRRNFHGGDTTVLSAQVHPPAAMRSSFTNSLESADQDAYKELKKREQQEWLRDLDRQRQDQARRKKMEKEAELGVGNGRAKWGDRGVVVGHLWEPVPSLNARLPQQPSSSTNADYLNGNCSPRWANPQTGFRKDYAVNSMSSPSLLNLNPTPKYEQIESGEQRTFIRGQNVPVDPELFAQRERKRLLALQHQEEIRKQIEERQERLRAEKAKRQQEEDEQEAKIRAHAFTESKRMEMEKFNTAINEELPLTPNKLITQAHELVNQNQPVQGFMDSNTLQETLYMASTRKNIESSMSSLSPDIPNPSFKPSFSNVCDSYTQTEDGKEIVYVAPTPVENILAEVEQDEPNSSKPKVKVIKAKSKKALANGNGEDGEEFRQEEDDGYIDKTTAKRNERERPQWGVPPKTKVYLKQSEKDPHYQKRLQKRKDRMKKREEEILRSKQNVQSKNSHHSNPKSAKPIQVYESDSEPELLMPSQKSTVLASGFGSRDESFLDLPSRHFELKQSSTSSPYSLSRPSRNKIQDSRKQVPHKTVSKEFLHVRSPSPTSRFRGTSPPVPALMRKIEEGVDPEEFGAAKINYDYDGLGILNEAVPLAPTSPPKLSPPVPSLTKKVDEMKNSKSPALISNEKEFQPLAYESLTSSDSSINLDLSLGEIPIPPRKGSSISKISSSTRTMGKGGNPDLPKSMILKDDNTQLDPRAESPLRRLLQSLQNFSIRGGSGASVARGGGEVGTGSSDADLYSFRSNLSDALGAATDLSARENLISFIMNQEDDEESSRLDVGISPRDKNSQDGILQFKIKVPSEVKTDTQKLSKLGLTQEMVGTSGEPHKVKAKDKKENQSPAKVQENEYKDPLSIEKRRTLDWLYGKRKGSGSSQSSLLSHLSSLKRGIKHQEEEWGIVHSDTEMSQASSCYPYSSN